MTYLSIIFFSISLISSIVFQSVVDHVHNLRIGFSTVFSAVILIVKGVSPILMQFYLQLGSLFNVYAISKGVPIVY